MGKEIFLTEVGSTSFIAVVPYLTESEEELRLRLLRESSAFIKSAISAMLYFGVFADKIRFLIGYGTTSKFSVLGTATPEGIDLYINRKNRILTYNCITNAVIYHEIAHRVDLEKRGKIGSLQRESIDKILKNQNDPARYSEWLYDEYAANKLLPSNILNDLKLVTTANFLGKNGDIFFEKMEKIYPNLVVAQVILTFDTLVHCYLPLYLNESKEKQDKFSQDLLKASKPCHEMWMESCKNVLEGKPVFRQHLSEKILLLIMGHQIPPKQSFWFNVNIAPLPMKFKGKKPQIHSARM